MSIPQSFDSVSFFKSTDKYKRLLTAKKQSLSVITHYSLSDNVNYQKYAERTLNCSPELKVRITVPDGDILEAYTSIEDARWCHVRHCPMCQLAKVGKFRVKLFKSFSKVDLSNRHFVFLTLTIRNRPLSELRESLDEMAVGWKNLYQRRTFPAVGFLRGMEVTMQRDRLPGDKNKNTGLPTRSVDGQLMSHPHFHVLLEMDEGYFTSGFKPHQWFVDEWQSALKVDYKPSVSIRKVSADDLVKSLLETVKYTVKPADFALDIPEAAEWLYGITEQLHGLRSINVGGSIAKICSQKELNQIEDSLKSDDEQSQLGDLLILKWQDSMSRWDVFEHN